MTAPADLTQLTVEVDSCIDEHVRRDEKVRIGSRHYVEMIVVDVLVIGTSGSTISAATKN